MGHIIEWDNDAQTVLLQAYDHESSKDDLYLLAQKSERMLNSVEHTVHIIIDERAIDLKITSSDMLFLQRHVPANQGAVVVVVSQNTIKYKELIQRVGRAIAPAAFDKPYFATNIDEARAFLWRSFDITYPPTIEDRLKAYALAINEHNQSR